MAKTTETHREVATELYELAYRRPVPPSMTRRLLHLAARLLEDPDSTPTEGEAAAANPVRGDNAFQMSEAEHQDFSERASRVVGAVNQRLAGCDPTALQLLEADAEELARRNEKADQERVVTLREGNELEALLRALPRELPPRADRALARLIRDAWRAREEAPS